MDKLIYNGNTADFRKFARAGVTSGNYNERALKYLNYLNGNTSRSLATAIKKAQSSGVENVFNLFSNGEQGAWYDPSDLTTLYQDIYGDTPVGADGDPISIMLDKSQGLNLGPELLINGNFDTDTSGWTPGQAVLSWESGAIKVSSNGTLSNHSADAVPFPTIPGRLYRIKADILEINNSSTAGFITTNGRFLSELGYYYPNVSKTYTLFFYATSSSVTLRLHATTDTDTNSYAIFDNVSVREIRTNYAYQPVSSGRRLYKTDSTSSWMLDDLVDDGINAQLPDLGTNASLAYADVSGTTILTGQTISGETALPSTAQTYGVIYLDRPFSAVEAAQVTEYFNWLRGV